MAINYTDKGIAIPDDATTDWGDEFRNSLGAVSVLLAANETANGVFSGLEATDGGGLQVDYTKGVAWVDGENYSLAASTKTATAGTAADDLARNYLYVNSSGVVTISTTAPTGQFAMLAVVDCDASAISAIYDYQKKPRLGKNLIANAGPDVWAAGESFSNVAASQETANLWQYEKEGTGDEELSIYLDTSGPTQAESGDVRGYALTALCSVIDAAVASGDGSFLTFLARSGEGLSVYRDDLTLSFWVKSNVTGIYSVDIKPTGAAHYSYLSEITVNAVDTWEKKKIKISIPFDAISYAVDPATDPAYRITVALSGGSSFYKTPDTDWTVGNVSNKNISSNQVNLFTSTSNYFSICKAQLETGPEATRFDRGNYNIDTLLAASNQRVFGNSTSAGVPMATGQVLPGGVTSEFVFTFNPLMITPSLSVKQNYRVNAGGSTANATYSSDITGNSGSKITLTHASLPVGPAILETNGAGDGKIVFNV